MTAEKTIREVESFAGGRYWVSADGEVFMRLRQAATPQGYLRIGLRRLIPGAHCEQKTAMVHRLIAEAFVPNPLHKPVVNHIDGIKGNNSAANLEWATASENKQHAYDTGLHEPARGEAHGMSKLTEVLVREIRRRLAAGERSHSIAAELNVGSESIARLNPRRKDASWRHVK